MINKVSTITIALSLLAGATVSQAADPIRTFKDDTINGIALDMSQLGAALQLESDARADTNQALAQSGIRRFQVYAVGSEQAGGWELTSDDQYETQFDHGGGVLRVAVAQVGFGETSEGVLDNRNVRSYLTHEVCGDDLHYPCKPGEEITALIKFYAFDGMQGGHFFNSAISRLPPEGFWRDEMFIH
ncbi:MAG: hypothetical protein Tsb002_27030 [Wenzhouxiangellaceae bacterium]